MRVAKVWDRGVRQIRRYVLECNNGQARYGSMDSYCSQGCSRSSFHCLLTVLAYPQERSDIWSVGLQARCMLNEK